MFDKAGGLLGAARGGLVSPEVRKGRTRRRSQLWGFSPQWGPGQHK